MINNADAQWLVVTDLDGTLLNHHDYTTHDALPAIRKLKNLNIPIIFNTSKTYSESISLQMKLDIEAPFIVENGSCIYFPKSLYPDLNQVEECQTRDQYWEITLGKKYSEISKILQTTGTPTSSYQLLSSCSPQEASVLTGLSVEQAEQAITREFSEPLIWKQDDEALNVFKKEIKEHSLNTLQGGRFLHVLGDCDKGIATNKLKDILTTAKRQINIIVLGDSENDVAMLEVADISIIVNSPSSKTLQHLIEPAINTFQEAPSGWNEGIEAALIKINNIRN